VRELRLRRAVSGHVQRDDRGSVRRNERIAVDDRRRRVPGEPRVDEHARVGVIDRGRFDAGGTFVDVGWRRVSGKFLVGGYFELGLGWGRRRGRCEWPSGDGPRRGRAMPFARRGGR